MHFTDAQLDEAILLYRRMTSDEFREALARSPEFKSKIEMAYQRGVKNPRQNFMHFDNEGWTPAMFNRPISPKRPDEDHHRKWIKPIPGAAIF